MLRDGVDLLAGNVFLPFVAGIPFGVGFGGVGGNGFAFVGIGGALLLL